MVLTAENLKKLTNYLEENYKDKFIIQDLFHLDGRSGYKISEKTNSSHFYCLLGTSDIFGEECYPPLLKEHFKAGDTKFDIAFSNIIDWIKQFD
jgi:hypothetical protein